MENKKTPNGKIKTLAKSIAKSEVKKVVKTPVQVVKATVKVEEKPKQSITELVEKYQRINLLISKRKALYNSINKLDSFSFSSDKMQDRLVIKDGLGNSFETSNSAVIEKLTDTMKDEIFDKIKIVESEIEISA